MKWKLEIIDLNAINKGVDIFRATHVELFMTLDDVWKYIGGRLKKERCGYAGTRNNMEYIVTRWV